MCRVHVSNAGCVLEIPPISPVRLHLRQRCGEREQKGDHLAAKVVRQKEFGKK